MSARSVKTRHALFRPCRDARIHLRPCMRSSASLISSTPLPSTSPPPRPIQPLLHFSRYYITFCFPRFSRDSSHRTPSEARPEVSFSARMSRLAVVSASSARRFFSPTVAAHCASRASTLSLTAFSSACQIGHNIIIFLWFWLGDIG